MSTMCHLTEILAHTLYNKLTKLKSWCSPKAFLENIHTLIRKSSFFLQLLSAENKMLAAHTPKLRTSVETWCTGPAPPTDRGVAGCNNLF